ncbi:uncharacterized protein LOC144074599 isoform X2 [Stigmatopora argus]
MTDVTLLPHPEVTALLFTLPQVCRPKMNLPVINSTTSESTRRRKREAERSVNWTVEETQVLLCAWSDRCVQKSLSENLRNRHVFKHLSARMSDVGFSRSPHQCRLRVKTLKANYTRAKVQKSLDASQPCSFKYFEEMDAVLGRPADGPPAAPLVRTLVLNFADGALGQLSSSDEQGSQPPRRPDFHVKMENAEESEVPEPSQERRRDGDPTSPGHPKTAAPSLEKPGSPPQPAVAHEDVAPARSLGDNAAHRLEPAVQHLAQCYQQLLTETRVLLAQLERQRQEQASWHQELLGQWVQRQREAAEREERREKAHMEHQIQVLELLTCLVREQSSCKCGAGMTTTARAAEVSTELHHIFTKGEN